MKTGPGGEECSVEPGGHRNTHTYKFFLSPHIFVQPRLTLNQAEGMSSCRLGW